jgi:hypothetical protein
MILSHLQRKKRKIQHNLRNKRLSRLPRKLQNLPLKNSLESRFKKMKKTLERRSSL